MLPEKVNPQRLTGSVAIVTGGGGEGEFLGLGATTAILLAAQGAKVGILDFSPERAAHTLGLIGCRPMSPTPSRACALWSRSLPPTGD